MAKLIMSVLCMAFLFSLSAQNATLKGTIKDKKGEPVIGANIMTAPGNQGTVTDFNGAYSVSLAAGSYKITTSYIGFTTQINNLTLAAGETKIMDFSMEDDNVALGDVVVVGSRTAPRSSTTSSLTCRHAASKGTSVHRANHVSTRRYNIRYPPSTLCKHQSMMRPPC